MKVPENVKKAFDKQALVAVATSDKYSMPNVVPIFWKKVINNDTILFIDNFMKRTKNNILENENLCVSFWNSKTEVAYKLKGIAKYYIEGKIFELGKKFIQSKNPAKNPKGVIEFKIKEIFDISPGPDAGKSIYSI